MLSFATTNSASAAGVLVPCVPPFGAAKPTALLVLKNPRPSCAAPPGNPVYVPSSVNVRFPLPAKTSTPL